MDGDRGLRVLAHPDQWERCGHLDTTLVPGGGVTLTWCDADPAELGPPGTPAGLAFDGACRAYRTRPPSGRVEVLALSGQRGTGGAPLDRPVALAVDDADRLYVAETGTGLVHVLDLDAGRRLAATAVADPVDLACAGRLVWVLSTGPARLVRLEGHGGPFPGPPVRSPRCRGRLRPVRLALDAGEPVLLWSAPDPARTVVADLDGTVLVEVPGGTDLDVTPDGSLIVACGAGRSMRRFTPDGGLWVEAEPLDAPDHDGGAIAVAPNGRVAFTIAAGLGWTAGSAARHVTSGVVVGYRLDSGAPRTRWGRVFLDACVPPGTAIRVRAVTADDGDVPDPVPRHAPDRLVGPMPDLGDAPPMPSGAALAAAGGPQPVFRRTTGREQPWVQIDADDPFDTFEAPVVAAPGRYVWLELTLSGTARTSPKVRALRVEVPGHRLLYQLPRAWSRDEDDAAFLQRLLAPAEGLLHELDQAAADRVRLVDPATAPQEALGWLAGFAGLVLDRRWPDAARRTLIAEAFWLYRRRGTEGMLRRILKTYLGRSVVIVEEWRLRGLGGITLGTTRGGPPAPAVSGSARHTGSLGRFVLGESDRERDDSFAAFAHRFRVLVPGELTAEQRSVTADIIEAHKPAHTLGEVCELGPGMRVGRVHVGLTSFVGPQPGWERAVLGRVQLGRDGVVGSPAVGAQLGRSATVGEVRVG